MSSISIRVPFRRTGRRPTPTRIMSRFSIPGVEVVGLLVVGSLVVVLLLSLTKEGHNAIARCMIRFVRLGSGRADQAFFW